MGRYLDEKQLAAMTEPSLEAPQALLHQVSRCAVLTTPYGGKARAISDPLMAKVAAVGRGDWSAEAHAEELARLRDSDTRAAEVATGLLNALTEGSRR